MISLVGLRGPVKGRLFFINKFPFQIGRGPKNDMVIPDSHASMSHAMMVSEDEGVFLVDLNSTNGTLVNNKTVVRSELKNGDTISIGSNAFRVDTGGFSTSNLRDISSRAGEPLQDEGAQPFATLKGFDHTIFTRPQEDVAMLRRSHKALTILYDADSILTAVRDLEATMARVMDLVAGVFEAHRAFLMLIDPDSGELRFRIERPSGSEIVVSSTISEQVLRHQQSVLSKDALEDARFAQAQSIMTQKVRSFMCAPLKSADRVLGMIYVDREAGAARFAEEDLKLLTALGFKAGVGVENAMLYNDIQSLFLNTIETIIDTIRAKDTYTRGHSERVRYFALMIGNALHLDTRQMENLALAAVLHDVGKIGMPDRLLYNKDALSPEEFEEIKLHPAQGAELLSHIPQLKEIVPVVRHHHEAMDGSGYPDKLKGEDIPLLSRIIAVADTYDACTTDRPYQKGMTREKAVEILRKVSGRRLDPKLVETFIRALGTVRQAPLPNAN